MTPIRASLLSATSIATVLGSGAERADAAVIYSLNGSTGSTVSLAIGQAFSSGVGYTLVTPASNSATLTMTIARINGPTKGSTTMSFSGAITTSSSPIKIDSVSGTSLTTGTPNNTRIRTFTFTPATTGAQSSTMTVTGINSNSSASPFYIGNSKDNTTVKVTGTGVAPLAASIATTVSLGTIRAGTSTTASLVVQNKGDGNLAGKDDGSTLLTNLRGKVASAAGVISGAGGSFSLTDTTGGQAAASATATFSFNYAPTTRGSNSVSVTTTLDNGANNKNESTSKSTTVSGTAVGPDYGADLDKSGSAISSGSTINFGELSSGQFKHNLLISNISNDAGGTALTNMTITAQIIGDAASEFSFSLSGFFSGNNGTYGSGPSTAVLRNMVSGADLGALAVQFVSKAGGSSTAQLRIQTDEESPLGTMGSQVYLYTLRGVVPEPGTLMILGTGLLGLAVARRRRRIAALTDRALDDAPVPV